MVINGAVVTGIGLVGLSALGACSAEAPSSVSPSTVTIQPATTERSEPGFDYRAVDYDLEPAGDALSGDRSNPAFPPPLVDIDEIRSGGPPPDGIPAIDAPVFAPVGEISFMDGGTEAIIAVTVGEATKGYPVRIMTWHEIVNDSIDGVPVTVTYCPLCNSALV